MNEIAEIHHPVKAQWLDLHLGWVARIAAQMRSQGAHPARTIVLLPYAQLMPVAAEYWAQAFPDGFSPRFETTMNWSQGLREFTPTATDVSFDAASDLLTAQDFLADAGLTSVQDALAPMVVMAAHQLAPLAAAVAPDRRIAWASQMRLAGLVGLDVPALAWEAATASMALAWVAHSAYATDVLFDAALPDTLDSLIVLEGFTSEPLLLAMQARWKHRFVRLAMVDVDAESDFLGAPVFHPASDAEDEAQRAATCVLAHVVQGRVPVALIATDRSLTRRVRAMLESRGVSLRDENGWKLSTSRAGAHVMGALQACVGDASADEVLAWLKSAPGFDPSAVRAVEQALRKSQLRVWHPFKADASSPCASLVTKVNVLREGLQHPRPLAAWLAALQELLQQCGLWPQLAHDLAGEKLKAVLHLAEAGDPLAPGWASLLATARWARRNMRLTEFTIWVNTALEAASFLPQGAVDAQVVILPMSQVLGRVFAATVMPGCDEVRLNPSTEPAGIWTPAQREVLGLANRVALEAAARGAWRVAVQAPHCDVLWRTSDEGVESLLPSSLVQQWLARADQPATGVDARGSRTVMPMPTLPPQPTGQALPVNRLSASAYEDLRQCPYRFFALRQLGLKEADELDAELDKRDFGIWLHDVLRQFHEALQAAPADTLAMRQRMLDAAAAAVSASMHLDSAEFLPFAAAWPAVRAGYLAWLTRHEASGAAFEQAEVPGRQPLGDITLIGHIDRIDALPDGSADGIRYVIDYKTEAQGKTRQRIKSPQEDTQLAFYAALLPDDGLRAAYVNIGEREATQAFEQLDVVSTRDALIESILHDMQGIRDGAPLPALGEGAACDYCAARGLCRKDFWSHQPLQIQ